jgi:hypothetical protein
VHECTISMCCVQFHKMKKIILLTFLFWSCSAQENQKNTLDENDEIKTERNKYKLISPVNCGKQYLTEIGADIYYHGKVNRITLDSTKISAIYFLSKAVSKGPNQNGINDLMFYDFQYSDKLIDISDFDSSKFQDRSELLSFDVYNSIWGELKGDSIHLKASKHLYDSRLDEIIFIKK